MKKLYVKVEWYVDTDSPDLVEIPSIVAVSSTPREGFIPVPDGEEITYDMLKISRQLTEQSG